MNITNFVVENNLRTRYLIYCIFNPNFHIFQVQSNPRVTINWSNIFITFKPTISDSGGSTRIGNVQTVHWEYMIFNILSMKSSDSNTNMMHQAGCWSLGKIMLGRLIPSSSKFNASSSYLESSGQMIVRQIYVLLSNIWHLIDPYK